MAGHLGTRPVELSLPLTVLLGHSWPCLKWSEPGNVTAMQPKIILNPAWAEQEGFTDTDIASLFGYDLSSAVPSADNTCPKCRNHPVDSAIQFFVHDPAMAPENVSGRGYVRCLCGTMYHYAAVHAMNVQQPVGEAQVRPVSEVTVPVGRSMMSEDVLRRRSGWHPAYDTWTSRSRLCGPLALIISSGV
jgi:hypothetical protein